MEAKMDELRKQWLDLSKQGLYQEARDLYYDALFPIVSEQFAHKYQRTIGQIDVLFSILGYSPEPALLMQKALKPRVHIICHAMKPDAGDDEIKKILQQHKSMDFTYLEFRSETFDDIYATLREQMLQNPSSSYAIDITGGKKSMVASAAIFGKDYNCKVLYVDFDQYDSDLRKPIPGYERLNVVYDPIKQFGVIHNSPVRLQVEEITEDEKEKYTKRKRYKVIDDMSLWGVYSFNTASRWLKCNGSYIAIWDDKK